MPICPCLIHNSDLTWKKIEQRCFCFVRFFRFFGSQPKIMSKRVLKKSDLFEWWVKTHRQFWVIIHHSVHIFGSDWIKRIHSEIVSCTGVWSRHVPVGEYRGFNQQHVASIITMHAWRNSLSPDGVVGIQCELHCTCGTHSELLPPFYLPPLKWEHFKPGRGNRLA